jgi:nitrogen fixation NifU-like protein
MVVTSISTQTMALEELYREVILDHYRHPRHKGTLVNADLHAEGLNPSCGDEFSLDLVVTDGVITDVATQGQGCSISQASGSMMADAIKGKTIGEVADLVRKFRVMMSIDEGESPIDPARPGAVLGDLESLQGVRKFPVRIKCADLPWATLTDALSQTDS